MPYTDPEEFIDIDDASLLNDGNMEFQMDLSAPHPALYDTLHYIAVIHRHKQHLDIAIANSFIKKKRTGN